MKIFLFFIIINILIQASVYCAPEGDLVTSLPDYNYTKSKIYSGYLEGFKNKGKKLHYILVESQNFPSTDPVVLWLNGGPGCSSLFGFTDEHGPLVFDENGKNFIENPFSWNLVANMLYLESPAGVGFSTYSDQGDRTTNDVKSGQDNLIAIVNFFDKFPEYKGRDFYISGESYAGVYIPYLAANIIDYNLSAVQIINLKGILIGNGVTDRKIDSFMGPGTIEFLYDRGMFSYELKQDYEKFCKNPSDTNCKFVKDQIASNLDAINLYDIYRKENQKEESFKCQYNYTPWVKEFFTSNCNSENNLSMELQELKCLDDKDEAECLVGANEVYFNRDDVKDALHVDKNITWKQCSDISYKQDDKASFFLYPNLIKNKLKIWIYSGDTDVVVSYNGTRKWIQNLNLPVKKPWFMWELNNLNVGYVIYYQGLTFLTYRGAGHMVPQWRRPESYKMFNCFLNNIDLN